jgi:hypothetical protein
MINFKKDFEYLGLILAPAKERKIDGFAKSPSVLLRAGLRFTPQFLTVWHGGVCGARPKGASAGDALTIETIVLVTSYEIIKIGG